MGKYQVCIITILISCISLFVSVFVVALYASDISLYSIVHSGINEANCTTIYHEAVVINYGCTLKCIESCPNGQYVNIIARGIPCTDTYINESFATEPIASTHIRYWFTKQPLIYYSYDKYKLFMSNYGKNPLTAVIAASVLGILSIIVPVITTIIIMCNRSNDDLTESTSTKLNDV